MPQDTQSQLSSTLAHLRHELRTPINAIIGYSEMLLEDIEDLDKEYINELQAIKECGVQLSVKISTLLNPAAMTTQQLDLQQIIANPQLKVELRQPTQAVISYCQQLEGIIEADFISDLSKIEAAAKCLLTEIDNIANLTRVKISTTTASNLVAVAIGDRPQLEVTSNVQGDETILVVDDNETNGDLLVRQLEVLGYQAVRATNGQQAIAMIQQGIYDLILLDILMPELNGYEVLQWIKQSSWRHIPVIMISAVDEIDSVVQCIELGAEDYLSKPFNPTLLKARISACLQKKQWRDRETLYLAQLAAANAQISQLNDCLQAENLRLSTELEVTQRLQTMMLPQEQELSLIEQLEISGFMQPADEVGGDYYDVLQHDNRIIIGIGDVTGHGLESGVLMLMVQTAVRTLMENNETEPKKYFEVLNRTIYKNLQRLNSDKNLTLCLLDYQDGILSCSGQHEELIVVRSGGSVERIDTIDLGFPLGLEETIADFVFQAQIKLNEGDTVVLYTDGITESENNLGVQYGLERLCSLIQQNWQKSALEIRELVIENLQEHIGVEKIDDDITLVVIKQRSSKFF